MAFHENISSGGQSVLLRYRNRAITANDLEFIKNMCASPWTKRNDLFKAICKAWEWRQINGNLSIYACHDLLKLLEARGLATLPPPANKRNPQQKRFGGLPLPVDLIPLTGLDVRDPDADLKTLIVRPIHPEERLGWRIYMERFHYLGDRPIVGENLLYAAFLDHELVALLGWASAALNAPLREAYIGWDEATKRRCLHLVVNNVRFLLLPWVRVRNLASKILSFNLRRLSADWQEMWKHPVFLAETFVDQTKFYGTSYQAANWIYLGQTAGRQKRGNAYLHGATKKALYVYPLRRNVTRWLREWDAKDRGEKTSISLKKTSPS
jgi:hypothetical protein